MMGEKRECKWSLFMFYNEYLSSRKFSILIILLEEFNINQFNKLLSSVREYKRLQVIPKDIIVETCLIC